MDPSPKPALKSPLPPNACTRALERTVRVIGIACGWWLIGMSLLTCTEMLGRKVLGFSLQGVDEIGSYTFAVITAFGFSYALLTRGHTRVDFLVARLPAGVRGPLNAISAITLGAMAAFFAWRAWFVLAESIDLKSTAQTPLSTPLWIPQTAWFAAYALFAVVALATAGHAAWLAVRGRWDAVNAAYGPQTLEEEIEAEAAIHVEHKEPRP